MKPYEATDPSVVELHAACGRILWAASSELSPLPSLSSFVSALNEAAVLSGSLYEGVPLRGALTLLDQGAEPHGYSVRLLPGSAGGLRSVVAAAQEGQVVLRGTDAGGIEVVGLDFDGFQDRFNIRFLFPTFQQVFIRVAGLLVGRATSGRGIVVAADPLGADTYLSPALSGFINLERLTELLRAVAKAGAGGIVVIDPSTATGWGTALIGSIEPWRYGSRAAELVDDDTAIANFLHSAPVLVSTSTGQRFPLERRELREREGVRLSRILQNFGSLARSDGAIVLRPTLELAGFGWRLEGTVPASVVAEQVLPGDGQRRLVEKSPSLLGGTRTQGAIGFVNERRECVAFVVSSDGPVSMVHFDDGHLRVLRGVEALM